MQDVALLTHMCGTITIPSFRQDGNLYPRQLLPASVMDSLSRFRGVFEYGKCSSTVSQCENVQVLEKHSLVLELYTKVQRSSLWLRKW